MVVKNLASPLIIAALFPSILNTNGDAANAKVLAQRARWAGFGDARLIDVEHVDQIPDSVDVFVVGACGDPDVVKARDLLLTVEQALREAAASAVPVLAVATGWHVLSHSFSRSEKSAETGVGIFSGSAIHRARRVSDDVVVDSAHGVLVGYENHSRDYALGRDETPLGTVVYGSGNADGFEGAVNGSLIGTHLHGPVLARNPVLADHVLSRALARTGRVLPEPSAQTREADRFAAHACAAVTAQLGLTQTP